MVQEILMTVCVFCNILSGLATANFVLRDDLCAAFMDIHPVNPGHVLVVPLTHAALLSELDRESVGHILRVAQHVDIALRASGINCEGVNLFLADGHTAGQEVMHVHLHVIPRFHGDGHHLRFSPAYFKRPSSAELEESAESIRNKMRDIL
jgi:histidine triad (HIT) family protein